MRDEDKLGVEGLLGVAAEHLLLVRVEIKAVFGLVSVFLQHDLLCLTEGDGRNGVDRRDVCTEQFELLRTLCFQILHHMTQHTGLHLHDIAHGVDIGHLEVQTGVFVQMTGGRMALCTEHIADLEHASVDTGEVLLVELRRLREICLLTEIAELKDVRAALSAGRDDLRGGHVHEALLAHILGESVCDGCLNAENRLHARMAQRNRTVVQIGFQIDTHILFAQRHRHLLIRTGKHTQVGEHDFKAVFRTDFLADIAGHLDNHGVADFRAGNTADGVGLNQTLNQSAVYTDNDE